MLTVNKQIYMENVRTGLGFDEMEYAHLYLY